MRTIITILTLAIIGLNSTAAQTSGTQNLGIKSGYTKTQALTLLADNGTNVSKTTLTSSDEKLGSVAEQIKAARLKNNMTIEDLATAVGLSLDQIEAIEAGKSTPMRSLMVKFEEALDITIVLDASENQRMSVKKK